MFDSDEQIEELRPRKLDHISSHFSTSIENSFSFACS